MSIPKEVPIVKGDPSLPAATGTDWYHDRATKPTTLEASPSSKGVLNPAEVANRLLAEEDLRDD